MRLSIPCLAAACTVTLLAASNVSAQGAGAVEMSDISGPVERPRRHFRLRNPAELGPDEAESIYAIALPSLGVGYGRSGHPAAGYRAWRRYNAAPYLSSTHGNHYINNYANAIGSRYGEFDATRPMPVGTVLAKDSFAVTETGGILLGPMFVMEKMHAGFNALSGDWRYTLVQPDGQVLGTTGGEGGERVNYCIGCHAAVQDQDHLYFIPEAYRRSD